MLTELKRICSIGTGTMGPGITLSFACAGFPVTMFTRSEASLKRGFERIKELLDRFRDNGLVQEVDIPEIMRRISGVTNLAEATAKADFIIEAISEDLDLKQEVFAQIEKYCSVEAILASSTSGLTATALAEKLENKGRFVVAHFWNPPHLIPLVEIAPSEHTSQKTVDITAQLLEDIGKKPVILKKEVQGFIGNRLQFAMLREALFLIESGIADKEAIDTTIKYALGRRLATTGPFESADLSGLDVISNIAAYLFADLCNSSEVSSALKKNIDEGRLGAKSGSGFYEWDTNSLAKIQKLREDNLLEWLNRDKEGYLDRE